MIASIEDTRAMAADAAGQRLENAAVDRIVSKLNRKAKSVCTSEHLLFVDAIPTTVPVMESDEGTAVCVTRNHVVKYFELAYKSGHNLPSSKHAR
jgi:hypothetical protein